MTPVVERMARAIAKADFESRSSMYGFLTTFGEADDFANHRWQLFEGCARAAIEALAKDLPYGSEDAAITEMLGHVEFTPANSNAICNSMRRAISAFLRSALTEGQT